MPLVVGTAGRGAVGPDGMYYLFNIRPGPYTLQVWDRPSYAPLQYTINVYHQPWTDIAPLQVR